MLQMASGGPRFLGVQYELDGIIHGLIANRDRRYVYGEVVYFKRWCVCVSPSEVRTASHMCCTRQRLQHAPSQPKRLLFCLHLVNTSPCRFWNRLAPDGNPCCRFDLQEAEMQRVVRALVRSGQLDFAGGGWVSNDEAICHYEDIIDQMTLGHR